MSGNSFKTAVNCKKTPLDFGLKILRNKGFICFSDFRRKSGMWKIAGSRGGQLLPYVFISNAVIPAREGI